MTAILKSLALTVILLLLFSYRALAHNPETSYCRVSITPREVVFKFTYDLLTLQRMVRLDTDLDSRISRAELQAAAPAIETFLRKHIYLDLNQREAAFGQADPVLWPEDTGNSIPATECGQRLISFTFRNPVLSAPEDVTLTFDFFEQLGGAHHQARAIGERRAPVRAKSLGREL